MTKGSWFRSLIDYLTPHWLKVHKQVKSASEQAIRESQSERRHIATRLNQIQLDVQRRINR